MKNRTIPSALQNRPQWVLWHLRQKGEEKPTKVPINPSGYPIDAVKKKNWMSYKEASKCLDDNSSIGLGFALSEESEIICIDLDNVRDPETSEIKPEALRIVNSLNSFTEVSQSGKGLHIFIKAKRTGGRNASRIGNIEIYSSKRFIAMTGSHLSETPLNIEERQEEFNSLYDGLRATEREIYDSTIYPDPDSEKEAFCKEIAEYVESAFGKQTIAAYAGGHRVKSDEQVIVTLLNSRNQKAKDLWNGEPLALMQYGSDSQSDQALSNCIARFTRGNPIQTYRLFRKSHAGARDKWDRPDYAFRTIKNSIVSYFTQLEEDAINKNSLNDTQDLILGESKLQRSDEILAEKMKKAFEELEASSKPLSQFKLIDPSHSDILFEGHKDREFPLKRGHGWLFISRTGSGKTILLMQAAMYWACGLEAFGFKPVKPIKILFTQAEYDEGQIALLRDDIMAISQLEGAPLDMKLIDENLIVRTIDDQAGVSFLKYFLPHLINRHDIDLYVMDHFLQYFGGDANDQTAVAEFLRNNLTQLLRGKVFNDIENRWVLSDQSKKIGVIICGHTNKTGTNVRGEAYSVYGSSEIPNWARGIINLIPNSQDRTLAELELAKVNGHPKGWTDEFEVKSYTTAIQHYGNGYLAWRVLSSEYMATLKANEITRKQRERVISRVTRCVDVVLLTKYLEDKGETVNLKVMGDSVEKLADRSFSSSTFKQSVRTDLKCIGWITEEVKSSSGNSTELKITELAKSEVIGSIQTSPNGKFKITVDDSCFIDEILARVE